MNINTNIYKQYINSGGSYSNHTQKNFSVHEKKSEKKQDSLYFSSEAAFLKDNIKAIKSCAADIVGLASEERISAIRKASKTANTIYLRSRLLIRFLTDGSDRSAYFGKLRGIL